MRYYRILDIHSKDKAYIAAIGTGSGGSAISEQEYNQILAAIQQKPARTATTDFRLKEDLTWEEYERPTEIINENIIDDASEEESKQALHTLLNTN